MARLTHRSLIITALFSVTLLSASPAWGNRPDEAAGSFHVTIFFPESDGSNDPNLENWEDWMQTETVDNLLEACLFWAAAAPASAGLTCSVGYYQYSDTPTQYEPITRDAGRPLFGFWGGDEHLWINEMMDRVGSSSIWRNYFQEVEDYNDAAQETHTTDEAISVFIANSLNDDDGEFPNDMSAYVPELRAPYMVLTWDNNGWRGVLGDRSIRSVAAHEFGHLFGAEDEYSGSNSSCDDVQNGYQNANHEDCPGGAHTSCLMRGDMPCGYVYPFPLCYWTRGQVGWEPECSPYGICGRGEPWECPGERLCIGEEQRCDGVADCTEADDELGCGDCEPSEFRCDDGSCVPVWHICECVDLDEDGFRDFDCGGDDCDDSNPTTHPGAEEACNGIDDDCDEAIDEDFDRDGDGFTTCMTPPDCDDDNSSVYPGAEDHCGNLVDEDCDGADAACECPDFDEDGFRSHACGGDDCDDTNPEIGGGWPDDCDWPSACDGGVCPDGGGASPDSGNEGGCSCTLAATTRSASTGTLGRLVELLLW